MRTEISLPAVKADPAWRIGVVYSSYYKEYVDKLVSGATEVLIHAGIPSEHITEHIVHGCFEIPLIGSRLAKAGKVDALIGLGIVVQGDTHHAELIAREASRGMMDVQIAHGIPFANEVLFVKKLAQAKVRSAGAGNKGGEAARCVLHSLAQIRGL